MQAVRGLGTIFPDIVPSPKRSLVTRYWRQSLIKIITCTPVQALTFLKIVFLIIFSQTCYKSFALKFLTVILTVSVLLYPVAKLMVAIYVSIV